MSSEFTDFDLSTFWGSSDYENGNYVDARPTSEVLIAVEADLGYKVPAAYVELAMVQNGGVPRNAPILSPCDRVPENAGEHATRSSAQEKSIQESGRRQE